MTAIDKGDRLLRREDEDVSAEVQRILEAEEISSVLVPPVFAGKWMVIIAAVQRYEATFSRLSGTL